MAGGIDYLEALLLFETDPTRFLAYLGHLGLIVAKGKQHDVVSSQQRETIY
jgi:hypothetical protein